MCWEDDTCDRCLSGTQPSGLGLCVWLEGEEWVFKEDTEQRMSPKKCIYYLAFYRTRAVTSCFNGETEAKSHPLDWL